MQPSKATLRTKNLSRQQSKLPQSRPTSNGPRQAHTRHFKSLSHVNSQNAVAQRSEAAAPLKVNNNITNTHKPFEIRCQNVKNAKSGSFVDTESVKSGNLTQSQSQNGTKSSSSKSKSGHTTRVMQPVINPQIKISSPFASKADKLKQFRARVQEQATQGQLYDLHLKDIHETLQQKELLEGCDFSTLQPAGSPLTGHDVTKEYRAKMMDWMIEVCTSFKCSARTYFLSTQIFDQYLRAVGRQEQVLTNKEVHGIGVTSMYLASKYEDIFPLHSKIVSDKIAHKAIPAADILCREKKFLALFDYQLDFVTHYDFYQTYADKIERQMNQDVCPNQFRLMGLIKDMALLLIKMSVQNVSFCSYSQSTVVLACFYAATAFLKHSKKHEGDDTSAFCTEARRTIFRILQAELASQNSRGFKEQAFVAKMEKAFGSAHCKTITANY